MSNSAYHQPGPTSPYGSGDPYYNKASGYVASGATPKSSKRNWLKIGIPIAIIVIVGAVVGGVLGSRSSKKNSNTSGDNSNNNNGNGSPSGGPKNGLNRLPTSTDPFYGMPVYPSSVSLFFRFRVGISRCSTFFSFFPFANYSALWTTNFSSIFPLVATRPTPHFTANQRSPPIPSFPGRATPSTPQVQHPRLFAQTVLDLSPLLTNGRPFRTSLPQSHISTPGISPFSRTRPTTTAFLLSSTSWMVPAVSLTTPEKSR